MVKIGICKQFFKLLYWMLLVRKGVPEKVTIFSWSEGKAIRNKRILFVYLHMYSEGFMQLEANFIMVGIQ